MSLVSLQVSQRHARRCPPGEQAGREAVGKQSNLLAQRPPSRGTPNVLLRLLLLLRVRNHTTTTTAVRSRRPWSRSPAVSVSHSRSVHSCSCSRGLVLEAAQEGGQHPDLGEENGGEGGGEQAAAQAGAFRVEHEASKQQLDQEPDVGKLHPHPRPTGRLTQGGGTGSHTPGAGLAVCWPVQPASGYCHHSRAAGTRRQMRVCGQEDQQRRLLLWLLLLRRQRGAHRQRAEAGVVGCRVHRVAQRRRVCVRTALQRRLCLWCTTRRVQAR